MVVPTEKLHRRQQIPEVIYQKKPNNPAASQAAEMQKKQNVTTQKTLKAEQKKTQEKQRREQIAKDNVYFATEQEAVNKIDFNELFTDNLPQDALDLREYVENLKDKDSNSEQRSEEALKKAMIKLEAVKNISTHQQPFYLMVSDIITPPKGVQMVRAPVVTSLRPGNAKMND